MSPKTSASPCRPVNGGPVGHKLHANPSRPIVTATAGTGRGCKERLPAARVNLGELVHYDRVVRTTGLPGMGAGLYL